MKKGDWRLLVFWSFVLLVVCFFYHNHALQKTIEHELHLKESCIKYFDKYRDYLNELYTWDDDRGSQHLSQYEMFYNKELNTCVSAYSLFGDIKIYGTTYPTYIYSVVDYLNGEAELYGCKIDTYIESLSNEEHNTRCLGGWNKARNKYKNS